MRKEIDFTRQAKEILTGLEVPIWDGTVGMMVAELKEIYYEGQRVMRARAERAIDEAWVGDDYTGPTMEMVVGAVRNLEVE